MRHSALIGLMAFLSISTGSIAAASGAEPSRARLKVFISVDMEGVAGVVTADQLGTAGFEYERFRRFMTNETLAAVRAAKDSGATEIVVADSHGNGESLLVEEFPKEVRIVRSWPRHGGMMGGLDATFDAALFIGYHASTTNPKGVRAHTISSARFTRVALNGTAVTEAEFNAAYAGAFGVPIVFASGDDAAVAEITARLGDMETVTTKKSLGFHSAETLTPAAACDAIYAGVVQAFKHRDHRHPLVLKTPVALEVSFKNYQPSEILSYLRSVQRIDSHSVRYVGHDMQEISDFMDVLEYYSPDAAP